MSNNDGMITSAGPRPPSTPRVFTAAFRGAKWQADRLAFVPDVATVRLNASAELTADVIFIPGPGYYRWNPASTAADPGTSSPDVIAIDGVSVGRWERVGASLMANVGGVTYAVNELVAPSGSTVSGGVLVLAASGGGTDGTGGTVPTGSEYTVFVTSPVAGSSRDVGPVTVGVRVIPAPPAGSVATISVDQADLAAATIVGETGSAVLNDIAIGSHTFAARFVVGGITYRSTGVVAFVANQSPVVTIVSPVDETDIEIGTIAIELTVTHPSADPSDFTVQVALNAAFTVGVANAVWESGSTWRASISTTEANNYRIYARAYDATPGGSPTVAGPVRVSSLPPYLPLTTAGATYNPRLEVAPGTTVLWTFSDGSTSTSLEPMVDFGSPGIRQHTLVVTPWSGARFFNNGFDQQDDRGREALPITYNHPNQNLVAMGNPGRMSSLVGFLSAHCPLAGTLDFTGFDQLRWIECFQSALTDIRLDGCTALRRLCVEQCNLSRLDIRPVAANLYDLRAADMEGGALELFMGHMPTLYHFCTRSQIFIVRNENGTQISGDAFYSRMPNVEELSIFDNQGLAGPLRPRSPYTRYIDGWSSLFDALDLANQIPTGRNGYLAVHSNPFAAIDLTGCQGIQYLDLHGCNLSTALVDYVLGTLASFPTTNGTLNLAGCSGPSPGGQINADALIARGWDVTIEDVVLAGVNVDEFTRADGAVGNGWTSMLNNATAIITSNALVMTAGGYGIFGNAGNALPANVRIETEVPDSTIAAGFFGIAGRINSANGTGVRLLFTDRTTPTLGNSSGWNTGNVTITVTNGFPASWALNQVHTLELSMVGTRCAIICDGQEYGYGTVTVNAASSGLAYGVLGEGGDTRVYNRMAAVAI
jgi:hypothetical protein